MVTGHIRADDQQVCICVCIYKYIAASIRELSIKSSQTDYFAHPLG